MDLDNLINYGAPETLLRYSGCGKSSLFCHSERSEESLFDFNAGKERFLGAQRALIV